MFFFFFEIFFKWFHLHLKSDCFNQTNKWILIIFFLFTRRSFPVLKTLSGHLMWWCDVHQLRMFSQLTVFLGLEPSIRCNKISSFWALIAKLSISFSSCKIFKFFSIKVIWKFFLLEKCIHLSNCRMIGGQANNKQTIGLSHAAARPRRQMILALVQYNAMMILLLA